MNELKQPRKVSCLQCGAEFEISSYYEDSLGAFTVCPDCGGSFDIDIAEEVEK